MDMHTHFLRDDTRLEGFVRSREAVGKAGWNPALAGKPQTLEDLKFANYFKEIYFDSDTKVALITGSRSEEPRDWFLTNEMKLDARDQGEQRSPARAACSRTRSSCRACRAGWTRSTSDIATLKPDSFKGYTVGDNTNKHLSTHPWRMDDEKLLYPFYEKLVKAGLVNVCVHKGLYPPSVDAAFPASAALLPTSTTSARRRRTGRSSTSSSTTRRSARPAARRASQGRHEAVRGDRPRRLGHRSRGDSRRKFGVKNVYGDLGQIFAQSTVAEPRLCAAMMGMLIKGLGADHVVWGTDAVWTGAPQWQIEGAAPARDPRGHAEEIRLRAAGPGRRPGEAARSSARTRRRCTATTSRRPPGATTVSPPSSRTMSATAAIPPIGATATSFLRDAIRHRRIWPDRAEARGANAGRRCRADAVVGRDCR